MFEGTNDFLIVLWLLQGHGGRSFWGRFRRKFRGVWGGPQRLLGGCWCTLRRSGLNWLIESTRQTSKDAMQ